MMDAEDVNRKEGWQYSGALIYDMKTHSTRHQPRPPLIGRIIDDHRAMGVMSNYEGIILQEDGMHIAHGHCRPGRWWHADGGMS
jgi:hypothetical protein